MRGTDAHKPSDDFVAQWPRNATTVVRVKIAEFEGRSFVDVREWYYSADGLKPGKKGITILIDQLPNLRTALKKCAKTLSGK